MSASVCSGVTTRSFGNNCRAGDVRKTTVPLARTVLSRKPDWSKSRAQTETARSQEGDIFASVSETCSPLQQASDTRTLGRCIPLPGIHGADRRIQNPADLTLRGPGHTPGICADDIGHPPDMVGPERERAWQAGNRCTGEAFQKTSQFCNTDFLGAVQRDERSGTGRRRPSLYLQMMGTIIGRDDNDKDTGLLFHRGRPVKTARGDRANVKVFRGFDKNCHTRIDFRAP